MSIGMFFTGIEETFAELHKELKSIVLKDAQATVTTLEEDLKHNTPVDTGHARDSWEIQPTKDGFNVINPVPYIDYLNQGSSQQAPAFFIETTALKYGTPQGAIVEPL